MKILVTGGAGFIGSAVVRHIINNTTDSVINLDKLTYAGNLESLANVDKSDRYAFEQVDICDVAEPLRYYHNNVYGTMVLLQAMQATEVYRLVFLSSATVYGEPKQMPITETCPVGAHHSGLIGEDPNDIPNNLLPYISQVAVSKLPQLQVYGVDYPSIKISCPTFKS